MNLDILELGPLGTNCYILRDGGEALIIDPGDCPPELVNGIVDKGLRVTMIVNTHGHYDHVLGDGPCRERFKAPLAISAADAGMLQRPDPRLAAMFGVEQAPVEPDRLLADGDLLTIGTCRLTVAMTPGHTPGGICLIGDGYAFTGDTIFLQSIGRTDLPGGNQAQLLDSIRTRILTLPPDTVLLPGHGPETTVGAEREHNPYR